jgi:hypothetical protein
MKLKRAIVETEGNLTRAAYLLDVSKAHVMALARRWGLNDWARDIRIKYGHPPAGRPRIIT